MLFLGRKEGMCDRLTFSLIGEQRCFRKENGTGVQESTYFANDMFRHMLSSFIFRSLRREAMGWRWHLGLRGSCIEPWWRSAAALWQPAHRVFDLIERTIRNLI